MADDDLEVMQRGGQKRGRLIRRGRGGFNGRSVQDLILGYFRKLPSLFPCDRHGVGIGSKPPRRQKQEAIRPPSVEVADGSDPDHVLARYLVASAECLYLRLGVGGHFEPLILSAHCPRFGAKVRIARRFSIILVGAHVFVF